MKRKALTSFLAFASAVTVVSSQALGQMEEGIAQQVSGQGYGVAGCGLGSVAFGQKEGAIQIAASIVNNLIFPQTFAITSGTSNCDIPQMGQEAAMFIEANKEVVRREAVMGQGESIEAIAMLLQCESSHVQTELKGNFEHYLGHGVDSFETVRRLMKTENCSTQG